MLKTLIGTILICAALTSEANACTGNLSAGVMLTGLPVTVFVRNSSGCAALGGISVTASPSNLVTISFPGPPGEATLTPALAGTGTLSITEAGFSPISVPLTVSLGTMELDSQ